MAFDKEFRDALNRAKIPVILGNSVLDDGSLDDFAPGKHDGDIFGAVNILDDQVIRRYITEVHGTPSLAVRAVLAVGEPVPTWAAQPFRLHFYGPNVRKDGGFTYDYVPAYAVAAAAAAWKYKTANKVNISPEMFKDKIVLIGGTARGVLRREVIAAIGHLSGRRGAGDRDR